MAYDSFQYLMNLISSLNGLLTSLNSENVVPFTSEAVLQLPSVEKPVFS